MSLRLAKVVAVHAATRTVDIVFTDTSMPMAGVQVMGDAGSSFGSWSLPSVPKPRSKTGPDMLGTARDLVALIGTVAGMPVVLGFTSTMNTAMAFKEDDRAVSRHVSGTYSTIAPDGSVEVCHASGAYVRIGMGDHQNLADVAANGGWEPPAGAAPAQITVSTAGFKLTVLPNGSCTLHTDGQLVVQCASADFTGDTTIRGKLDVTGEVTAKAGSGGSVTLSQHRGHVGNGPPPTPGT